MVKRAGVARSCCGRWGEKGRTSTGDWHAHRPALPQAMRAVCVHPFRGQRVSVSMYLHSMYLHSRHLADIEQVSSGMPLLHRADGIPNECARADTVCIRRCLSGSSWGLERRGLCEACSAFARVSLSQSCPVLSQSALLVLCPCPAPHSDRVPAHGVPLRDPGSREEQAAQRTPLLRRVPPVSPRALTLTAS